MPPLGLEEIRLLLDSLQPGDRIRLKRDGYEIIVGMPSDLPEDVELRLNRREVQ